MRTGSEMTVEGIYREFYPKILRYVRSRISSQEAEDLCSAIWLKIQKGLAGSDSRKASLSTWIFTITRNAVTDYFRTRRTEEELSEEIAASEDPADGMMEEEALEELAAALEKLPTRECDIIILHYYTGISLKEIAARMGMSYSNLKLIHGKALSLLRQWLS